VAAGAENAAIVGSGGRAGAMGGELLEARLRKLVATTRLA